MREVRRTSDFAVIDDLLSPGEFDELHGWAWAQEYSFLNGPQWFRTLSLEDGNPLEGKVFFAGQTGEEAPDRCYPTGTPLDRLIAAIDDVVERNREVVGRRDRDWSYYSARSFIYPRGTGLGWHSDEDDSPRRTGAFTYYLHPRWRRTWGGELLLEDAAARDEEGGLGGIGTYVLAAPNRLVLLRAGVQHAIRPVHTAAGENARFSVAGFFMLRVEPRRQDV
jgi:hypothetical protein